MCKDGERLDASVRLALAELRARQPRHPSLSRFGVMPLTTWSHI